MIYCNPDGNIEFDVSINNASQVETPQVFMVIDHGDFSISYKCEKIGNTYSVHIKPEHCVGELPFKIDVKLGFKIFTPFSDVITLDNPDVQAVISGNNKTPVLSKVPPIFTFEKLVSSDNTNKKVKKLSESLLNTVKDNSTHRPVFDDCYKNKPIALSPIKKIAKKPKIENNNVILNTPEIVITRK